MNPDFKLAYNYCIRILSRRDYSIQKIRTKLNDRDHDSDTIEAVISMLVDKGYLNEASYIRSKIKHLLRRHYSSSYIQRTLERESLSASIEQIEHLLTNDDSSVKNQINSLLDKKLRSIKNKPQNSKDTYKLRAKLLSFLYSKGHSPQKVLPQLTIKLSELTDN